LDIEKAVATNSPGLGRKMDNSDENKNNINDKPEGEPEEIPYWLQGFEESVPDETTPIVPDAKEGETWIKESEISASDEVLPPDSDDEVKASFPQIDNLDQPQPHDSVLAEAEMETDQGSEDETSIENEITEALDDYENTDEIEIDALPVDEFDEPVELEPDELPSPEGFVDISDLDLPEPPPSADGAILEVEAKEGELPEWLQEMISEPETSDIKYAQPAQLPEEEPVQESVDELDINWEKEDLEVESMEDEPAPLENVVEMDNTDVEQEVDVVINIADEDTTPISTIITEEISSEEEEPKSIELESDEQQTEFSENSEEKNTLEDLKYYLNQKHIHQALKIINDLDDEKTDYDEITPLLLAAAENDAQNNSDLWEVVGDIAMKQEKPHDALDAYTKAIRNLLANDKDDDEIN
jgi:hypothetical protein